MEKFICVNCKKKVPFKEIFKFKKGQQTICPNCFTVLKPKNIKSWNWGFAIGFAAFVVPYKMYLKYHNNFFVAASVGTLFAVIAVFIIALYTYKTVEFEEL